MALLTRPVATKKERDTFYASLFSDPERVRTVDLRRDRAAL